MEYQKVTSVATFSKKLTNSHSFGGNSIYDGVFSSIPAVKVGSLVEEDYGEIFSGSGGSSIPILQVPELNERKVSVDVNSSRLDYSKIFGGVGEFDFAASHEQLFATKPKKRETSAEEPRAKAVTGSCPSDFSEENQVFSHGASCQPFDGMKQFKMSYHKTNQGRENGINGTTHIAQLNSVPGYSCLINEVTPSQMTEGDKPSLVLKKSYLNINYSGEKTEGKDSRKAVSSLPTGGADKQASGGVKFQKKSNQSGSNSIDMLFDAQENGLRTRSSKVPLPTSQLNNLGKTKGDFERLVSSNFGVSKSHSCEDASGFCSSPTFDEEVDSNSVAAASAAAVKKAIEEAQAKIRLAKEIMERKRERKREGLQNHVKLTFKDGSKAKERREGNITNKSNKSKEEAWDKFGKADIRNQVFPGLGMLNSMKAGQVTPDLREGGKLFFTKEASGETDGNKNKSTLVHHRKEEMNGLEAEELGESGARVMRSTIVCEWEDKSFVKKTFEKPEENGEKLETVEETHKQEEVKKLNVVKGACELKECANEPKSDQEVNDQGEYGTKSGLQEETDTSKSTVAGLLEEETDSTSKSTVAGLLEEETDSASKSTVAGLLEEETDSTSKSTVETDTISKSMVAGLQEETDTSKASRRLEIREKKQRRLWDLRANEPKSEQKVNIQEEYRMKSTVAGLQEEIDTASKVSHRLETCAKKQRRLWDLTANRTKLDCLELWDSDCMKMRIPTEIWLENENKQEVLRLEEKDIKSKDVPERGENKEELHEIFYDSENQDILNGEDAETSDDFLDGEQSGKILEEDVEVGVKEEIMEAEENGEILREAYQMKEKEIHGWLEIEKIQTTIEQRAADYNHSGNSFESANGLCKQDKMEILSETVGIMEGTRACREMETELESNADELEEKEVFEAKTSSLPQVVLEFDKMQTHAKDTTEDCPFEYNGVNERQKHVEELACESEENFKEVEEVEDTTKWGKYESASEFSDEERWNDIEEIVEASPITSIFQEKEETTKTGNEIETNQNTEKYEENHSETPTTEEREAEGTMQKEVEQEEEHVRKIDEAKEKEREREKERIAVERAIREARERAFTEARERAERNAVERANAEAHRRAMAEAREKLEKVPAEANVKLSADKSSMEARLKAQRAAVERATAEARERALEKAMSEKAALEARNQAGKFSHASRDNGKRRNVPSNDCQYKGSGPTRSSGDPSSSNLGVTHSTAKSDKVDGESAQRHQAKLERHQQTAERAAKALAEKNMRDLLAQKEQAERNRLAETVDADVKRWSSGKQGNLRALLSTLQYVLGPDSGWQPVPLTDLITTTAVKKTYRKATLFVHPDKLQQRGASIQQKYICEKVFDLLKEAWNKFS